MSTEKTLLEILRDRAESDSAKSSDQVLEPSDVNLENFNDRNNETLDALRDRSQGM